MPLSVIPQPAVLFSKMPALWRCLVACANLFLALNHTPAIAETSAPVPDGLAAHQNAFERVEIARVRIHNSVGGTIEGSRDGGATWQSIGHVLLPAVKVNPNAYLAAKYAQSGSVAATAVNALHFCAGQNLKASRGIIWSMIPAADTAAGRISLQSELGGTASKALAANAAVSPDAALRTDIPGGSGLFGGFYTPFVGNKIWLEKAGALTPLADGYVPAVGDAWVIPVEQPRRYPVSVTFENVKGGAVTAEYRGEEPKPIARVLRPVGGVGRFVGSFFAEVGRIRANHCGVIDLSTSLNGKVGSFQIVPEAHAREYGPPFQLTQYLIISPLEGAPPLEGTPPLFYGYIRPRFEPNDINKPLEEGLLGRFGMEFKYRGDDTWHPAGTWWMEQGAPLWNFMNSALSDVTHIRIRFPFTFNATPEEARIVFPHADGPISRVGSTIGF